MNLTETNREAGEVTSEVPLETKADAYKLESCTNAETCEEAHTHLRTTLGFGGTLTGINGSVTSSSLGGTDSLAVGHTALKCGAESEVIHPYVLLHISERVKEKAADSVRSALVHLGLTKSYAANPIDT